MTQPISKSFILSTAIAFAIPTASVAEVSATDVWESWKSYAESFGQTVTVGSQLDDGGALILNDVKMAFDFPEGSGSSSLGLLEFRERGDGTVAITMGSDMPFSISMTPDEGEAVDLAMIMRQSGMSIIASGEPENITFDYLASDFSFDLDTLIVDGEKIDVLANFALNSIDGQFAVNLANGMEYASQFNAANMTYEINVTDPDGDGNMNMKGTVADVATNSNVAVPEGFDPADPTQIFGGDFAVTGGLTAGASNSAMDFQDGRDGGENFALTTSSNSSGLNFSIADGSMEYGGSAKGIHYDVKSPQIPFPEVTLDFSEVAFNLLMPLTKSDDPQDYGFLMRLAGLEVNDMIWAMFDSGEVMPRGPATISIDLSGQMNWLLDITDPEQAEAFDDEVPAELHSLTINEILVSALGAEINATGDFTFDNSDLETFDGMPAPTGKINANIIGANGLMDRLVSMGFLPSDQAMAGRMMLGLFARPSGGEDSLESTIEINGDGSIFANGQQLR